MDCWIFAISFLICSEIGPTESEVYFITPSPSHPCFGDSKFCLTLSQFTANISDYLDPNTTLAFLPGDHSLYIILVVENINALTITSVSTLRATVTCEHCTGFLFRKSNHIHLSGLKFIGCGGSKVESVDHFDLEESSFHGQKDNCGSALSLKKVTDVRITHSSFNVNIHGSVQKYMNHTTRSVLDMEVELSLQSRATLLLIAAHSKETERKWVELSLVSWVVTSQLITAPLSRIKPCAISVVFVESV